MRSPYWVPLADEYLALRRKLGFELKIEGRELLLFARYLDDIGHDGPLTIELALRWATLPAEVHRLYRARRLDVVRRFASHRRLFDERTEVPPMGMLGPACRPRPAPHIYTDKEIAALLDACRQLRPATGLRSCTCATLFGLLACSGLRVSEALSLRRIDVDLRTGILTVDESKYHRSRLVPLHASTVAALQAYAEKRDRHLQLLDSQTFFVTDVGTPLRYRQVLAAFKLLRRRLGWARAGGVGPRIHDLRHSMACTRLLRWYEQGIDVGQRMLALSTYLGHVKLKDTYWYLTATPELMAAASRRFQGAAAMFRGGKP
jgi:integrase